jgi:hypothetical protein
MDEICSTGLNMLFTLQGSYDVTPNPDGRFGSKWKSHVMCVHCHVTTYERRRENVHQPFHSH